jgi:RNA polymerase sigma factor FliA
MKMQHEVITFKQTSYKRNTALNDIETLLTRHNALVRRIAWQVHSRMSSAIEIEDLIQIGLIALVESSRTFEDRGIAFGPYAAVRIRGAMIDELRRTALMSRAGMANRRKLAATRSRLKTELNREANDSEIAASLNLNSDAYHQMVASTQAMQQEPIDETYSDHDMWFADRSDSAETALEKSQLSAILSQNIARLPEREALVLQLYFSEEMNLEEIGETLNVGAARICQIKKTALNRLRMMMADADKSDFNQEQQ